MRPVAAVEAVAYDGSSPRTTVPARGRATAGTTGCRDTPACPAPMASRPSWGTASAVDAARREPLRGPRPISTLGLPKTPRPPAKSTRSGATRTGEPSSPRSATRPAAGALSEPDASGQDRDAWRADASAPRDSGRDRHGRGSRTTRYRQGLPPPLYRACHRARRSSRWRIARRPGSTSSAGSRRSLASRSSRSSSLPARRRRRGRAHARGGHPAQPSVSSPASGRTGRSSGGRRGWRTWDPRRSSSSRPALPSRCSAALFSSARLLRSVWTCSRRWRRSAGAALGGRLLRR